jgi:hypothetical protein
MNALITVELTEGQALALGQFFKRCGWAELRACAADEDEAYRIRDALSAVQAELVFQGFATL